MNGSSAGGGVAVVLGAVESLALWEAWKLSQAVLSTLVSTAAIDRATLSWSRKPA